MNKHKGRVLLTASLLLLGVSAAFLSCYPDSDLAISDYDIVSTFYDKAAPFATYRTFALDPTVAKIPEGSGSTTYDQLILTNIRQNMLRFGYAEIMPDSVVRPDVVVSAATTSSTYFATGCYGWYGGGYWGYYGGYYGCYPYTSYAYSTGTVLIALTALPAGRDSVQVQWLAGMNGVLDNRNLQSAIPALITRAFDQSPYLRAQGN